MDKELAVSTHHIRLSVIPLALQIVGGAFLVDLTYAFILLASLLIDPASGYLQATILVLLAAHSTKFLMTFAIVVRAVVWWATTTYYVNDNHLIRRTGIVRLEENVYELHGLRYVGVEESLLGKWLNYGSLLLVFGASGYREEVRLKGIVNPKRYEQLFRAYLGAESREYYSREGREAAAVA